MTVFDILREPLVIHHVGDADYRADDGEGADAPGRTRPALPQPLSAQLLGRPAAAYRHRARACAEARLRALRRAGVGARRFDPGAGAEPPEGPAGRARAHLPVHLAQPRRRRLHRRRDRGDVPRPHRRDRAARGAVPQPVAPVHAGPARRGALPGPPPQARPRRRAGRRGAAARRNGARRSAGRRRAPASSSTSATATACGCRRTHRVRTCPA